jgi:hypothetical protein
MTDDKLRRALGDALSAVVRARALAGDLDITNTKADRNQVAAGVRHELETIQRSLLDALGSNAPSDPPASTETDRTTESVSRCPSAPCLR